MGTKNNPGHYDCYASALPDEPMFVLLSRDPDGPGLVNEWADRRAVDIKTGRRPPEDAAMVEEARQCARQMTAWRKANDGAWRLAKANPTQEA